MKTHSISGALGRSVLAALACFVVPAAGDEPTLREKQEKQHCRDHMRAVYEAIQAYRVQYKKLPDWLSDLVPGQIGDTSVLLCPASQRQKKSITYGIVDPACKTSYVYEFCAQQVPPNLWGGSPMRMQDWKRLQMAKVGGLVPILRCFHHGETVLNITFDGKAEESEVDWEYALADKIHPSELSPQALVKWFRFPAGFTAE